MKPYKTIPYRKGCSNQVEYNTYDEYGSGSIYKYYAITTRCDYTDKKGVRVTGYVLRVKWIDKSEYNDETI